MPTISFSVQHFQHGMILPSVRWYLAYSLSYRDIEGIDGRTGVLCRSQYHHSLSLALSA